MRIVNLNELSEEKRKKVLEEQQSRLEQRQQTSTELQRQANQKFNEIVSKKGEYTPSRTTTIGNLEKAYKNNNTVKESLNNYYNNNKTSLWNQMQNLIQNKNIETNQSKMLKMSNNISYKDAVLSAKNKIDISKIREGKRNDILTNKANKNILFSERVKILPTTINQDKLIDNLANMNRTESQKQIRTITNSEEERKNLTLQVEDYRQTLKSQKEAEKINEDLKNGKYGSSVAHVLKGVTEEALNATIKTATTLNSFNPNNPNSDNYVKASKAMTDNYQEKTSMIDNDIVKTASNISGTIGQMVPSILANLAMPGSGGAVNAINVGSSAYQETLNENNSNKVQSLLTGGGKALASYGIEKLTGGNFLSKTGSLDDLAKQAISSKMSSNLSKRVASKIYEFGGEVLEEQLENQVGYVIDKVINNREITAEEWENDFNETTKNTILTTLVLNMLGLGGNTYNEIKNQEADVKAKKVIEEAEKIIKNEKLNVNSQQNTTINQNNQSTQQTIQEINKIAQNGNMEQILPTQNYYYEKSNNTKIDNLRKDANKYWDNSEKTKNYVNMLEKIIQDKNIDIRLDANLKDSNGNIANGSYSNGVITINPNSNRAGEFIAVHELTHAIGTDQMKNIVQKYRQSNLEFDTAVKSLLQNYNTTELTEEAMADVVGQLFGNQEFINNLAETEPNIFKKIYNEIKYLWHQFTGYKNQDQFINDLQYKWEQAYRNKEQFNESTNYSIAGRKSLENIRDNTRLYNSGISSYNQAQQMANQNISNEQIRQKTGWFQDRNGDWKYEFSDKDMSIKENIKLQNGKTYKLGDILKHDTLFTLYPELSNIKVDIKNTNKFNGNYNKDTNRIALNSEILSDSKKVEKTIIHEIQHVIQNIEKFETGITSKLSKKVYFENLGEIEATDVSKRFFDEKYNYKNINKVAPESSKANPKHLYYEQYMKNRKIIDKMKDSVFKYFTKGENSNEIIQKNMESLDEEIVRNSDEKVWDRLENDKNIPLVDDGIEQKIGDSNEVFQKNNQKNIQQDIRLVDDGRNGRYLEEANHWQKYLEENYKPTGTRTNLKDIKLPTKADVKKKANLPTKENINQPTQGEKIDWNTVERPEGKMRKHYRSIIESGNTTAEAKAIAKELMGTDTYVPDSNNKQLERANERIQNSTPESELNSLMSRATTGGKIDATDIAVGEKLIQYYSLIGDKTKLQESIQATAMAGTTAGRTVQAMSLLNHQTPEGQAIWIQRSVEKMNNELKKAKGDKAQQFDFTAEMQEKIIGSKDKAELEKNLNEVYEELGQQVSKSLSQQIDSWRYFAMLGNFRTHIRNISGNFLMGTTQDIKSKVAGVIEGTVAKFNPDMERTHTIKRASKEVLAFAKDDIKNVADRLGLNDNKYNPKNRLENNMRTFKSNVMENTLGRMFKWNDNLLEAEDGLGLKAGYKKALAEYITANNIDINNITDKQLSKARNYAVQQAQERTFHQANTIASAINSFFGKNKATKAVGDAILPFVKTPANVAKTGIEYSPAGLAKSIVYDTVQLRRGNINVNQYIDNISKGLTGSAITVLGFALAQAGILKASGSDDDKKEKFDEQSGKQAYSIQIGDNTYTIDWLAPVGIPLMVGAEIYEGLSQKSNENKTKSSDDEDVAKQFWDKAEVLANSLSNTLDPMVEMSMISGLTSTVRSFAEGDTQALGNMLTNGAKSYVNQFIPTLSGQIAKTTDTVERDTTSTKNGTVTKAVDSTVNQIKSKIPGLRQTLPTKKDIWGNDLKLADNWAQRFFEAGILPTNSKAINKDKVVTELNNLYDKIGESSILPTTIDKTFTIDGQKYRMTNEEYNKYKTNYGKTSYKLIKDLVSSKEYNKMNNEQKQKAIENTYSYAKESNKLDYSKSNKLECEQSTLYTTMEDLKKNGGSQSEYLSYLSKITEVKKDKEKNQILADSSYTAKTKSIIYKNTTGKEDELYNNILLKDNININEYLNYKLQEFESDKKDDGTIQGKTVSGSKKKKVYEYVNNMNITPQQRMAILGTQYKLNREEQKVLYNYLNKIQTKTQKEKLDIFSKYSSNFTIYKDNALDFK